MQKCRKSLTKNDFFLIFLPVIVQRNRNHPIAGGITFVKIKVWINNA